MHSHPCGSIAAVLIVAAIAFADAVSVQAAPPPTHGAPGSGMLVVPAAGSGIDIVRMPQRPTGGGQPAATLPAVQPPPTAQPKEAAQS